MLYYSLWIESVDKKSLLKLSDYFEGLQHTLLSGRTIGFGIDYVEENDDDGGRGIVVGSSAICLSGRGIETLQDALETNEVGIYLYHQLRKAPDFRYALIGWDSENQTRADDLHYWVKVLKDGKRHWQGFECVINDDLYKELGSPVPFWQFREGYWWQKFGGETYNPLFSSDQEELHKLGEKLLPNNYIWSHSVKD